jgi:hypothetical protein
MPVSDLDITRTAHLLIADPAARCDAAEKARKKVDEMRRKGDVDGADVWLHIVVAIGTLGTPPTDARH